MVIFRTFDVMFHQDNMSVCFIPLTFHFYIVKLGFTGVYIILLFLLSNIGCGYSLEPLYITVPTIYV